MQLSKHIIDKFIKDPEWSSIEKYIVEFFANDTDIQSIDVSQTSDVVHAQVIARQSIDKTLGNLMASFDSGKTVQIKEPISYK